MGVPTSEVGCTIATTRRETTKVHKNMWWHWGDTATALCASLFCFLIKNRGNFIFAPVFSHTH